MNAIAHEYIDNGISVIPLALDGTKKPAIPSWKSWQSDLPTKEVANEWWRSRRGIGVICGAVSGGLEVMDFDKQADVIFPAWHRLVEAIAVLLPIVETPSGGFHVYYRCSVICGNTKIAMDDGNTLIETRGEGGYIVGVSSPASVHQRNYPYVQVAGPVLPEVPTISEAERLQLWRAARSFDRAGLYQQQAAKAKPKPTESRPITGNEPWRQFDNQADWDAMLRADGWSSRDGKTWTRPGKRSGTSATLRQASGGDLVLVVFSSNAGIEPETYSASSYLAHARYGGDFKRANQAIREGVK
ncbi:MAG: bifunctional DNA primase/polymerase [Planctomycetaceae bacterium]|nr:bifunctional DNA primase/polymerase [Planctomycetaceae bacterium]